jgi:hypothetical protein
MAQCNKIFEDRLMIGWEGLCDRRRDQKGHQPQEKLEVGKIRSTFLAKYVSLYQASFFGAQ